MRTLHPGNPCANVRAMPRLRQFKRDPGVSGQVMLGRIAAAMEIESQRGCSLLEGLAQKIDPAHDEGQGLEKTITSAPLRAGLIRCHFTHENPQTCLRENNTLKTTGRDHKIPVGNISK